ncbi:MAG: short-chain dehydrogenase [Candidatus Tectimicrobiota bacterium]|nr:MAG: short-chain dehydrogenase [Candidatus Tectomicrobia bacterium]
MRLQGKVALITGTSPNIGGGIALGMAAEGARVACVDRHPPYAHACAADIQARGGEACGIVCDVTDEAQVRAAVEEARRRFGGIDILVNNAVLFNAKGVLDMPLAEWRQQLDVILTGAFLCTKYVAQLMRAQGRKGSIINVISTAGHQGEPWNVGYCTAKAGLLNFTRSVAMELAADGIRVNSLTPTATDAAEAQQRAASWGVAWPPPRQASPQRRGFLAEPQRGVPLQRLPSPWHYARAAVFLASDEAAMITGIDLRVDAGAVARYWRWDPAMA